MTLKRRKFLQSLGLVVPAMSTPLHKVLANETTERVLATAAKSGPFKLSFNELNDRVWIGDRFWSVPMEDWEIRQGRLECTGTERRSRLHLLTHVLGAASGDFTLEATLGLLANRDNQGSVGFSVGIKDFTDPDSIKAACYFGQGVTAGVSLDGKIFLGDQSASLPEGFHFDQFSLKLIGATQGDQQVMTLVATDDRQLSAKVTYTHTGTLDGLVAVVNHINKDDQSTFWWSSLALSGTKVVHRPANSFGPILWAMYTLSDDKLKLMAQMPPIGAKDSQQVELQLKRKGKWKKVMTQPIDQLSYTAIFEITDWDATADCAYRVVYEIDGEKHEYVGNIRKEPASGELRFGGLTCQEWRGYPYSPLVQNLEKTDPDMLYFSGDQIYEQNGGYPIKRQPERKAILSYLGKYYMFGWAFGHVMRDRPTICTPDDHDVFQGNLWGEGGEGISFEDWDRVQDAHGGFVQTPQMVNVVNRTQCGHLPDPVQSATLASGITTWFTNMNYGRVSFAIVSDRLFKSGPEQVRDGGGRIDHIRDRLMPQELESEELVFMGQAQLDFLNHWIAEWEGVDMKVMLSQTLFSNVGTHHGWKKEFLYGDMDSGGWPKAQRDEVIRIMRKACVFHINGDQHLPFIVQYSVDEKRDGGWTFCTPAVSTGYSRWGQPDLVNMPFTDRPKHNLPNTGCYRDVFGNDNYVYAVGNPEDDVSKIKNRYTVAQMKASGFGLVTFDTVERTIKMEAFRFLAQLDSKSEENTYPGWPLTINQLDNDGRRAFGYLPQLKMSKPNQLVKIINEDSGELVQAIRVKGSHYTPSVYALARYTIVVGEGDNQEEITNVEITSNANDVLTL